MIDLEKIKSDSVTKGPWHILPPLHEGGTTKIFHWGPTDAERVLVAEVPNAADASLIANSPNLLAEVERLRKIEAVSQNLVSAYFDSRGEYCHLIEELRVALEAK